MHNHHPGRHRRRPTTISRHYGGPLDQRIHLASNKHQAAIWPTAPIEDVWQPITPENIRAASPFLSVSPRRQQRQALRGGINGCRDNTVLLDAILRSRYTSFRSLYIATLDIAKAFDSVDHNSLLAAAEAAGLPPEMILYLRSIAGRSALVGHL